MNFRVIPVALLVILLITEIASKGPQSEKNRKREKKKENGRGSKNHINNTNEKCVRIGQNKRNLCHEIAVYNCGKIFKRELKRVRTRPEKIVDKTECEYRKEFLDCVEQNRTKTPCKGHKKINQTRIKQIAEQLWSTRSCLVLGRPATPA